MYKQEEIRASNLFTDVDDVPQHFVKIMYSALYFAITFILLNYIGYAAMAVNAWWLDYSPSFSYAGIDNLTATLGWSVKRIAFVYLANPLVGLFISILSYYWYTGVDHTKSHLQQFYFWLSLNGFLLFYSYLLTGMLAVGDYSSNFFTGFVAFFSWLEWDNSFIYIIHLILAVLFAFYAWRYAKPILKSSYSKQLLKRANGRMLVFLNLVVFPFIVGAGLVFAITYPLDMMYFAVRICSYAIVFLIMVWGISNRSEKVGKIQRGGLSYVNPIWFLLAFGALVYIGRFWLNFEISF